jgi:hypothetical protein
MKDFSQNTKPLDRWKQRAAQLKQEVHALALLKLIPNEVMAQCREQAGLATSRHSSNWIAAAVIIGIWIIFAVLIVRWICF